MPPKYKREKKKMWCSHIWITLMTRVGRLTEKKWAYIIYDNNFRSNFIYFIRLNKFFRCTSCDDIRTYSNKNDIRLIELNENKWHTNSLSPFGYFWQNERKKEGKLKNFHLLKEIKTKSTNDTEIETKIK